MIFTTYGYPALSLLADFGGYVGLFLGYSCRDAIPLLLRLIDNLMVIKLFNKNWMKLSHGYKYQSNWCHCSLSALPAHLIRDTTFIYLIFSTLYKSNTREWLPCPSACFLFLRSSTISNLNVLDAIYYSEPKQTVVSVKLPLLTGKCNNWCLLFNINLLVNTKISEVLEQLNHLMKS